MLLPLGPLLGSLVIAEDNVSMASNAQGNNMTKKKFAGVLKSGGDSYLLGTLKDEGVLDKERCSILQTEEGLFWAPSNEPYSVNIASPKKETKFKGIKSFIAYQLTPSFNKIQVSRRYKHFDWLHGRLVDRFCLIPIPPLPDKQISGRYDDTLIEHRLIQLQEFVDWVCRHPVLSKSKVWNHFLTCTDEKRWKSGKRDAEKDPLLGFNSCAAVVAPEKSLLPSQVELQLDASANFVHDMEIAVKNLFAMCADQTKKQQNIYKREYHRVGEAFFALGAAMAKDEGTVISTSKLTSAARRLGGAYINIGRLFENQPRLDWEPLSHRLHIHRGVLGGFQQVFNNHKEAMNKKRECDKLTSEGKMEPMQMIDVAKRADVISYAVLAEISHVRMERDTHLKEALKIHLARQIEFYQNIVKCLQEVQSQFDD